MPIQAFVKAAIKCLVNTSHSFCTCTGDAVGLLIKTGNIQKKGVMTQTTICNF